MVNRDTIAYDQLDEIPRRRWDERIKCALVYVFPNNQMHDSGFMCMDFVALLPDGKKVRFGGGCDSMSFRGEHFCMECMSNGIIRVFNHRGFTVSEDLSTIMFFETERGE